MCGILAIFGLKGTYHEVRAKAIQLPRRQKHRGPDDSSLVILEDGKGGWNIICHERLSIVDTSEHGRQPKYSPTKDFVYAVNGEIYNYPEVRE
jgi:asparagine synthase (glutamine-hydrolysing)